MLHSVPINGKQCQSHLRRQHDDISTLSNANFRNRLLSLLALFMSRRRGADTSRRANLRRLIASGRRRREISLGVSVAARGGAVGVRPPGGGVGVSPGVGVVGVRPAVVRQGGSAGGQGGAGGA